jgi:hypothetical protein
MHVLQFTVAKGSVLCLMRRGRPSFWATAGLNDALADSCQISVSIARGPRSAVDSTGRCNTLDAA